MDDNATWPINSPSELTLNHIPDYLKQEILKECVKYQTNVNVLAKALLAAIQMIKEKDDLIETTLNQSKKDTRMVNISILNDDVNNILGDLGYGKNNNPNIIKVNL